MRRLFLAASCLFVVATSVFLGAQGNAQRVAVRLRLVDATTAKDLAGIVRVFDKERRPVELPGLFNRMEGMPKDFPGIQWSVVSLGGSETMLPVGRLRIEALSGLETALAPLEIDVGP